MHLLPGTGDRPGLAVRDAPPSALQVQGCVWAECVWGSCRVGSTAHGAARWASLSISMIACRTAAVMQRHAVGSGGCADAFCADEGGPDCPAPVLDMGTEAGVLPIQQGSRQVTSAHNAAQAPVVWERCF